MVENLKGRDIIARFGGEEFVIILQASDIEEAQKAFDRLRTNIAQRNFPQIGKITVSIGMVQVANQAGSSEIIHQADQALYYVKEHGRNQVYSYEFLLENALIEQAEQNRGNSDIEFF